MAPLGTRARALVFIGFMGAGKSRALRAAAAAGLETVDADELVERDLGMPIAEFFDRRGEAEFRAREAAVVVPLLERIDGAAVALGGGAVLSAAVREALDVHLTVWLEVGLETAWRRARQRDRPLARDRDAFAALHVERAPLYESLADAILPDGDDVAARALPHLLSLRAAPIGTRLLWATSASGEYPAFIGDGILGKLEWPAAGRRFCVADATAADLHAAALGAVEATIAVPPGERSKTLAEAERVLVALAGAGMRRDDHIVGLGGGVVGDLAGFCAAVYQRGVEVVHVPTTLVGQVDSAYGGKTGVDIPAAKNYVGAFHLPAAVIADTATLRTLPAPELAAGFVEVLKTALIAGGELWEGTRSVPSLDAESVAPLVGSCARVKLAVVAADERDSGRRAVLNLGHTVGHAIEAATHFDRYRHGEAVGLGLLAALRLSEADALREEVRELLERFGLPTRLDAGIPTDPVVAALARDKKATSDGVGFVLVERPGEVAIGQLVDEARVRAAVEELREEP